ncbi:MAG: hypothetical protein JWN38_461 [Candidatus Saccharibacteria bacterium]|nr:hypothetical protein [Candidatus Saccharibacteria bacterium]
MSEHKQEGAKPGSADWLRLGGVGGAIAFVLPLPFVVAEFASRPFQTGTAPERVVQTVVVLGLLAALIIIAAKVVRHLPFRRPWLIIIISTLLSLLTLVPAAVVLSNASVGDVPANAYVLNYLMLIVTQAGLSMAGGWAANYQKPRRGRAKR